MSEGVFISRTEWNQLTKKILSLEEWIRNNSKPKPLHKELTEAEAMEVIGCKKTKLDELRRNHVIQWRYSVISKTTNAGSGIRIKRSSVEDYVERMYLETASLETNYSLRKAG